MSYPFVSLLFYLKYLLVYYGILYLNVLFVAVSSTSNLSSNDVISNLSNVTLVITSCNRPDLLHRCLESLFSIEKYNYKSVVVADASGIPSANDEILKRFPFITYLHGNRLSQVDNIDMAYSVVKSKYILHFEEDWIVFKSGFIEKSIEVLEKFPSISVVSLHKRDDNFQRPDNSSSILSDVALQAIEAPRQGGWGHFTWGAGKMLFYLHIC